MFFKKFPILMFACFSALTLQACVSSSNFAPGSGRPTPHNESPELGKRYETYHTKNGVVINAPRAGRGTDWKTVEAALGKGATIKEGGLRRDAYTGNPISSGNPSKLVAYTQADEVITIQYIETRFDQRSLVATLTDMPVQMGPSDWYVRGIWVNTKK